MKTQASPLFYNLTALKNRIFFLALCTGLISSCQSFSPNGDAKETKAEKILDTNISFAQKQIDSGDPEQALQILRPLLKNYGENPALCNLLGITYLALSHPGQAKIYFEKAYKQDSNPMYALNLSSALISLGKLAAAAQVLQKPMQEKKYQYMERIYHNYALTFEKRNKLKTAVEFYKKALDENPSYYLSNLRLGGIYLNQNLRSAALRSYENARTSCRICIEPVNELAVLYMESSEYSKAKQILESFLANKTITDQSRSQAEKLLTLANKM